MKELLEAIKNKAVTFHDMIKSYSRSWEQVKVVKENKKWVKVSDVLAVVADFQKNHVIVSRKQILSLRDACMKADEKLGIESLATHILVDLLDGKLEG